ncbi:MAG TPA: long-chain fatty acid--CoA ligase, partial [Rhodospirillales bacterium]|nr:long-chain fatty acid--CoA ligase [Rhodospirillales bacterium]
MALDSDTLSDRDHLLDHLPQRISHIPFAIEQQDAQSMALIVDGDQWSYGRFCTQIRIVSQALEKLGIGAGDRVLLVGENGLGLITLIMAVSELDAWPVIVNARLSGREIDLFKDHCGARRVIFTTDVSPEAADHAARQGAEPLHLEGMPEMAIGPLDETTQSEPVDADGAAQVGAMIYTSGTTGNPKGVMLSHRGLMYVASVSGRIRGLAATDRTYAVLPVSHVFGLASTLLGSLFAGAAVRLAPRFAPADVLKSLRQDGITVLQGVPAMYAKILEHLDVCGEDLEAPHLRYLSAGGSPLQMDLKNAVEDLFGVALNNGYGLTECSPTVSQTRIDAPVESDTVGPLLPGLQVRFVDGDDQDLPPGEAGELWVKGPNLMLGYYRAPDLTAQVLTPDGWYKTGDIARL